MVANPERDAELLADLHERSRTNIKIWRKMRREGIDCRMKIREQAAVDGIVSAVDDNLRQRRPRGKPQTVLKWLNRRRIRREIDGAIQGYRTFEAVGLSQPWTARVRRGEEIIATLERFATLHGRDARKGKALKNRDDAAIWWDARLPRALIANLRSGFQEIDLIRETISPEIAAGQGRRRASIFIGSETALQWLIGERLASIYERWFRRKTTNQPNSAYVTFVQAVLDDAKIKNRNGTPISSETIFTYRKQGIRRAKK
ncbi:MAG: hypothetical protein EOR07_16290 [Mesorhizobium sp.]|nr:MAG: hypothetical protein EOR07_16290 [Mesorhizobium sp.]